LTKEEAYLCLNLLPGIGPVKVRQLLEVFGDVESIFRQNSASLSRVPGIGAKIAATIKNWEEHADLQKELNSIEKGGVCFITLDDKRYPDLLREIYDPPLCLYIRGRIEALQCQHASLAVVGSRRISRYGADVTRKVTTSASASSWTIVSGLALGVDTVAHQSTLDNNGVTVAVIGSGLGHLYPQENVNLAREICQTGAVISEFPMHYPPDRRSFPMRNRIIAGMTRGTLVVEAGLKSGSLITASQALEQNRQVFAIPGRIDSPQSKGCHALIKQGAKLVENFDDILEEFSFFPGFSKQAVSPAQEKKAEKKPNLQDSHLQLDQLELKILDLLSQSECSVDDLAGAADVSVGKLFATLTAMETKRLINPLPGKRYPLRPGALRRCPSLHRWK